MMYDLVLTGGLIVDGTGSAPYRADLCVKDGRIARITTQAVTGAEILDVTGLAVTPGFLDLHSHSDLASLTLPVPEASLLQGVTTSVVGNCGSGMLPQPPERLSECQAYCMKKYAHPGFRSVSDYAAAFAETGSAANYGVLVGHGFLRFAVMGFEDRAPNEAELEQMKELLEQQLEQGAFGMSLGLIYAPGSFCGREEMIALARVVAKHDGILAVHMRNEGPRLLEAVDEMLDVAEQSGVHLQISHLKLMGRPQWGKAPALISKIDEARSRGLKVTCDQYPFTASSTGMTALVPRWAHDGGPDRMLERLEAREGSICQDIHKEMDNRGGPDAVLVITAKGHPEYEGKYLSQIALELGTDPVEAVRRVLLDGKASVKCIYFSMDPGDVEYIMKRNYVCVGSDSTVRSYNCSGNPHPRNFAAFSQYFQTVREKGLLPLEAMVYKATGLAASILGLHDRGTLTEGNWADIVVFDPEAFSSRSTFLDPKHPPVGMHHVLVNGQIVVHSGRTTGVRSGRIISKK